MNTVPNPAAVTAGSLNSFYAFALAACMVLSGPANAKPLKDKAGGSDHPVVGRFQGAILINYGSSAYDEVEVPLAAYRNVDGQRYVPSKSVIAKGKVFNYFYWGPGDRSELEVFRNYQAALTKAGFKVLHTCDEPERCGKESMSAHAGIWTNKPNTFAGGYDSISRVDYVGNYPVRYLAAQLPRPQGDVFVTLTVQPPNSITQGQGMGARYFMQVIEAAPMTNEQVKVDAAAISKGLASEGRIALYGILFDTDQAILKRESQSTLAEMSKALQADPKMRVYIVGHTDNQGSYEHNLTLSANRAKAVVDALQKQGIASQRLTAVGVADVSPLANGATDAGRAKNRRVEMVAR
ncbi:OmpA family protein [Piscinibacter sp. HJYY11]|uniref:OmpA family protein n=1 Tax=Piscinibacter sp. HJYY11 TaxID=2801333 RepID=UPI00191DEB69|nr:OmpA family protein [Piscinibacter sp. HJYY11]MBL0729608.1 DUF4892 domain-containing protein [Piscinibacter sp. HJYY11]